MAHPKKAPAHVAGPGACLFTHWTPELRLQNAPSGDDDALPVGVVVHAAQARHVPGGGYAQRGAADERQVAVGVILVDGGPGRFQRGPGRPQVDVPRLLKLYQTGQLKLDELVTRRFPLAEAQTAFDVLARGEVARSVLEIAN